MPRSKPPSARSANEQTASPLSVRLVRESGRPSAPPKAECGSVGSVTINQSAPNGTNWASARRWRVASRVDSAPNGAIFVCVSRWIS